MYRQRTITTRHVKKYLKVFLKKMHRTHRITTLVGYLIFYEVSSARPDNTCIMYKVFRRINSLMGYLTLRQPMYCTKKLCIFIIHIYHVYHENYGKNCILLLIIVTGDLMSP